jgi:arylsulfatase A-like enzyme
LLKNTGLDENTLVIFSSDNGPVPMSTKFFESSKPLRGSKRDLYEGGIRVPLIARWPGKVAAGKTRSWPFGTCCPRSRNWQMFGRARA